MLACRSLQISLLFSRPEPCAFPSQAIGVTLGIKANWSYKILDNCPQRWENWVAKFTALPDGEALGSRAGYGPWHQDPAQQGRKPERPAKAGFRWQRIRFVSHLPYEEGVEFTGTAYTCHPCHQGSVQEDIPYVIYDTQLGEIGLAGTPALLRHEMPGAPRSRVYHRPAAGAGVLTLVVGCRRRAGD